ncbi:MAG: KGK domain-containing protein [Cyanobacteriota bacterium]
MSNYPYQVSSELTENEDGVIQIFVNRTYGGNYDRSTHRVRVGIETIGQFLRKLSEALIESKQAFSKKFASELSMDSRSVPYSWFDEGVNCEILKLGSNTWQRGKLKVLVSIEFYPDEPEESHDLSEKDNLSFPLDEIRREELHTDI